MSLKMQLYYNAIFGALSGLIAWFILGFMQKGETDLLKIILGLAPLGAASGLFLGLFIGQIEGTLIDRNFLKAIAGAFKGALAGIISGLLGFVGAQILFTVIGGEGIGRIIGWMFFGLSVGISQGLVNRSARKISYGGLGGLLGGLTGGVLYEGITQLARTPDNNLLPLAGEFGMVAVGASIGALFAFVGNIGLGRLVCRRGRREGTVYMLEEKHTVFGQEKSAKKGVHYLPDSSVATRHGAIERRRDGYYLSSYKADRPAVLKRDGQTQVVSTDSNGIKLKKGDEVLLGDVVLEFQP